MPVLHVICIEDCSIGCEPGLPESAVTAMFSSVPHILPDNAYRYYARIELNAHGCLKGLIICNICESTFVYGKGYVILQRTRA
jgi:hypothetical protein